MTNVTLAIDDDLLRRARVKVIEEGTSVNEVVRDFLREHSGTASARFAAGRRLAALAREHATRGGGRGWTRDDLHDRGQS